MLKDAIYHTMLFSPQKLLSVHPVYLITAKCTFSVTGRANSTWWPCL